MVRTITAMAASGTIDWLDLLCEDGTIRGVLARTASCSNWTIGVWG